MSKTCEQQVGALSLVSAVAEANIRQDQIGFPLIYVG